MMFAGLTSAYIVRQAAGDWVFYKIPEVFTYSTIVIVLSSLMMILSIRAAKQGNKSLHRLGLLGTILFGFVFTLLQFRGWDQLTEIGVRLTGNPSGSFLYLISGIHLAHLLGGILVLLIVFIKSLIKKDPVKEILETSNPDRFLGLELASTYWHFVGVLWIYLFCFFYYNTI